MLNKMKALVAMGAISAAATVGLPATAQVVQFTGADDGSAIGTQPNSDAAAASFRTAASAFGGTTTVNFEGVNGRFGAGIALPGATLSVTGVDFGDQFSGVISRVRSGAANLYAYDISARGGYYLAFASSSATFVLDAPTNSFGFYTTGTQTAFGNFTVSFNGNSATTLTPASNTNGGATFFGFTSLNPFTTVTISAPNNSSDSFGIDDVTFNAGAVPEPTTWAMMMLGFGGVGYAMRRKNKVGARIKFA